MSRQLDNITRRLKEHYQNTFSMNGPSSAGVDWGDDQAKLILRYEKMLSLLPDDYLHREYSFFDVGCGYGGLYQYSNKKGLKFRYTGIDVVPNMVAWGKQNLNQGEFIEGDFMKYQSDNRLFDFVVCNGILTQKLETSLLDMDDFAKALIKKMFSLCNIAIGFNIMSTYVNYFSSNLYYKHPAEMLTYCLSEISQKCKIDHSYGIYEYTIYLYK